MILGLPLLIAVANAATLTVYAPLTTQTTATPGTTGTPTTRTNLYVQEASAAVSSSATLSSFQTTAITDCHAHGSTVFCIDGQGNEGVVSGASVPTGTSSLPESFTGCHVHDAVETFCLDSTGNEVQFTAASSDGDDHDDENSSGENCHFHAGVEHCVGGSHSAEPTCERTDRDYNIPLRIGLLFVVLVTSALGSMGPVLVNRLLHLSTDGIVFVILKQFGTGVIISTALVHLITHAELMWNNECLTGLDYEATGTAITMAGLFIAFVLEYIAHRCFGHSHADSGKIVGADTASDDVEKNVDKQLQHDDSVEHYPTSTNNNVSVLTMEAGIIFHSILIGITLVVAGDSFFITLFIVIVFHQFFEGIALGSRIAGLIKTSLLVKLIMGFIFAIVTPIGMAIGIGVLSKFNGNNKSTLIALGTLDSFSAGVLLWTGLVEMWAADWVFGKLAHTKFWHTTAALVSLMAGMILMSVLGKWA